MVVVKVRGNDHMGATSCQSPNHCECNPVIHYQPHEQVINVPNLICGGIGFAVAR